MHTHGLAYKLVNKHISTHTYTRLHPGIDKHTQENTQILTQKHTAHILTDTLRLFLHLFSVTLPFFFLLALFLSICALKFLCDFIGNTASSNLVLSDAPNYCLITTPKWQTVIANEKWLIRVTTE